MEINKKTGTQSGKHLVSEVCKPDGTQDGNVVRSLFHFSFNQNLTVCHPEAVGGQTF